PLIESRLAHWHSVRFSGGQRPEFDPATLEQDGFCAWMEIADAREPDGVRRRSIVLRDEIDGLAFLRAFDIPEALHVICGRGFGTDETLDAYLDQLDGDRLVDAVRRLIDEIDTALLEGASDTNTLENIRWRHERVFAETIARRRIVAWGTPEAVITTPEVMERVRAVASGDDMEGDSWDDIGLLPVWIEYGWIDDSGWWISLVREFFTREAFPGTALPSNRPVVVPRPTKGPAPEPSGTGRILTAEYIRMLLRAGRVDQAWFAVVDALMAPGNTDALWPLVMKCIAAVEREVGSDVALQRWYDLEEAYENGRAE
ncbi:MAG: hypothetical protein Q7W30_02465, partial [Coriobacteriia bacterium]|nr:hypothetical protein [Coriobacteriia bacterium]